MSSSCAVSGNPIGMKCGPSLCARCPAAHCSIR
jgi:hypothetical protein